MKDMELIARCAGGFEGVLARELRELGLHRIRPLNGSVSCFGTIALAYRACLWSRVATRIQLVLARVPAADANELYESVASFHWEKHVRDGATVAVRAHGVNANLRNTQFTALKVKDGPCDRLREVRGARPNVDAKHPDFSLDVALHETRATLALNLAGESLHRRGWRENGVQTEAPLKETLAAGILLLAGWDTLAEQGGILADPMCGSGTFAIEGACMAAGIAPGLLRERWGFEGWVQHRADLWSELLEEARALREGAYTSARVLAGDVDARAIELAKANAERAGVSELVTFFVDDAANLGNHLRGAGEMPGLLVSNPPYGLRLLSQAELPAVRRALAQAADATPKGWQLAFITPDLGLDSALGRTPEQILPCRNGALETWLRLYDTSSSDVRECEVVSLNGVQRQVRIADEASPQFAARLRKNAKERMRWAKNEGVSCLRLYDGDLPDYRLAVDWYQAAGSEDGRGFAVVEEQARPRSVDVQRAGRHFADAAACTGAILGLTPEELVEKPWLGQEMYERTRNEGSLPVQVQEGGYVFGIDLLQANRDNLPLNQREVRAFVAERAKGTNFADLYAAGSAATVFAAGAGAASTTSIDSSAERLDWLKETLRANGLASKTNRQTQSDVRAWLAREAKAKHHYDLILCTPPERQAARKGTPAWDIEKDLPKLLTQLAKVLSPCGTAILALPNRYELPNNPFKCKEITEQLTPLDFKRSREVRRYYLLQ